MAKLTLLQSKNPLTKTFWSDGRTEAPSFSQGTFEVRDVVTHEDMVLLIQGLSHNQALCYSTPLGYSKGEIALKGSEDEDSSVISRTKAYFDYPVEEGWLFIDCDEDISETEVIAQLAELYEPFGTTSYVYATSASHGISGKKGFHVYFKVKDVSIVKPAMENLFNKAFNAGYGRCIASEAGSVLPRTFFDKAVYDRGRLDFISGPICEDFSPPARDIRVVLKENDTLDLESLLAPVDATKAIAKERAKVKPEATKARAKEAKKKGISLSKYVAMLDGGSLGPGTKLLLEDGSEVEVADILRESMQAYLDEREIKPIVIQHPIEHGLEEKTMLYYNTDTGVPRVHSFAHGGQTWTLKDDGSVISGLSGPGYLIDSLKSVHGVTTGPMVAPKLPLHKDTKSVLDLMKETFTKEYGTTRILEDQWREMISLFLHMLDGHRGRYSIELPPSHGKTQVILHVILWLYKSQRIVPISLSMFKIDDIERNKEWLLERMERQWKAWDTAERLKFLFEPTKYLKVRHSKEQTSFEDLEKTPAIIHTHHVVRKNDYVEGFFTYDGRPRHLFVYDEAMFRSLLISEEIELSIDHLNYAITRGESRKVKGLPVKWLKAFRRKIQRAQWRLTHVPTISDIVIEMPQLNERFVRTGYYLDDEKPQNFILTLMNIAATGDHTFRVSREKGGKALFAFKENDIAKLPRVINTDATRSVRKVHEYGSGCLKYPIEPYKGDAGVMYWIAPFKKTGRVAVAEKPALHIAIANHWLAKVKPKKVLVITSKSVDLKDAKLGGMPVALMHPNIQYIHWGQHKQTNDYRDCDAVIAMNYFRKKSFNYKHDIHGEAGSVDTLSSGAIREVERGFVMDELIQGLNRGCLRDGKRQNCLMFSPHNIDESVALTEALEDYIRPSDSIELFEYPHIISAVDEHYVTEQEQSEKKRKVRSDSVYSSPKEKEWAKRFRKTCRGRDVPNVDELLPMFIQAKREDPDVTPVKWLKRQETSGTIGDSDKSKRDA